MFSYRNIDPNSKEVPHSVKSYQWKRPQKYWNSICQGIVLFPTTAPLQVIKNIDFCRITFFRSLFFRWAMKIGKLSADNLLSLWKCCEGGCLRLSGTSWKTLFETWQESKEGATIQVHRTYCFDGWCFC